MSRIIRATAGVIAAQAAASWTPSYATFNGTTTKLHRNSALAGATSTDRLLFCWSGSFANAGTLRALIDPNGSSYYSRMSNDTVKCVLYDGANLALNATSLLTVGAAEVLILVEFNRNATSYLNIFTGGTWTDRTATAADYAFDLSGSRWGLCTSEANAVSHSGTMERVQMWALASAAGINTTAGKERFIDSGGNLVDPAVAIAHYGTPLIAFTGASAPTGINAGSGGDFVWTA